MRKRDDLLKAFYLLFAALGLMLASSELMAGQWRAGAATVMITPQQPMWMAGYAARTAPADGKLTELWAKALVLEDASRQRVVLITLDLVGIDRGLSESICDALGSKHGFARRDIAICTSHTHSGPVVRQNLSPLHYLVLDDKQQTLISRYAEFLQQQILEVVDQAIMQLAPSHLTWGSGEATFAVNRRTNPQDEVPKLRREKKINGPFDHDVPVLAVRDAQGALRAVVFGYACHATVLSGYQWSGDYPGYAQIELEKMYPGCTALFWAGCGGDQNPLPRRDVALAEHYGKRLALAVEAVLLTEEMEPVGAALQTHYQEIDLPLAELPTQGQLEVDAASDEKYIAARAKMLLAQMEAGESLRPTYPYPVQVWELGDQVQFVMLGGEVVVDYALRLKSELGGERIWVAAYANDVMAYIPSRRVLAEGGYEGGGAMVYYGLPTVWSPQLEQMIVDAVHEQLKP